MLGPTRRRGTLALGAAFAILAGASALTQPISRVPAFTAADLVRQPAQNWITNGGNVYNQRYSSLRQINRDNVARTQVDHTSLSTSSIA